MEHSTVLRQTDSDFQVRLASRKYDEKDFPSTRIFASVFARYLRSFTLLTSEWATASLPPVTTTSVERTVTAIMIPFLSTEGELWKIFEAMTTPIVPITGSTTTTSTSSACAGTGGPSVTASIAQGDIEYFCDEADHLVPINPTSGTSENFVRMGQNFTISVDWASHCTSEDNPDYRLTMSDCNANMNGTINSCDADSDVKSGGNVTVDCIVYAFVPQPYVQPAAFDNPTSFTWTPAAISTQSIHCQTAFPTGAKYNREDAASRIDGFCDNLQKQKYIMAGAAPYFNNDPPHSPGGALHCCSTSNPTQALEMSLTPFGT